MISDTEAIAEIRMGLTMLGLEGSIVPFLIPRDSEIEFDPTTFGFYDDLDELARDIHATNKRYKRTCYIGLNPLIANTDWPCVNNKFYRGSKPLRSELATAGLPLSPRMMEKTNYETGEKYHVVRLAKNPDIAKRLNILIDIDAGQTPGTNSNDVEHANTLTTAKAIEGFLASHDVPVSLSDSGNGHHAYVAIDLPNDFDAEVLVERFLKSLAQRFNGKFGSASVDTGVADAKRITKATGSLVYKGPDSPEHPCRRSHVISIGEGRATREQIEAIANEYEPKADEVFGTAGSGIAAGDAEIEAQIEYVKSWLESYDLELRCIVKDGGFIKVGFKCPNHENHHGDTGELETTIMIAASGALGAKCLHDCQGVDGQRSWDSWSGIRGLKEYMAVTTGERFNGPALFLNDVQLNGPKDILPNVSGGSGATDAPGPDISKSPSFIQGTGKPTITLDWRKEFKNGSEMSDVPLKMLIENFLPEESACFIAGLSGHGKTLIGLSIAKAFINKTPLFGHEAFKVNERLPVLYLIPECGEKSFKHRMKHFDLVRDDDMFLVRTFSHGELLRLDDERLLQAAAGRVVILDTAIRFTDGEENSSTENKYLANCVFLLLQRGARTIIGIHHSPKTFEKADYMSLENTLRGSGDIGAMLGTAYGVKMISRSQTRIQIECTKPRDFIPHEAFQIIGVPHINDSGDFKMVPQIYAVELGDAQKQHSDEKAAAAKEAKYQQSIPLFFAGDSLNTVVVKLHIGKQTAQEFKNRYDESIHSDEF